LCDENILQGYMPIAYQISQVIFQMTVTDSSKHDSGSDVGCHYQDSCMEKAIMFLVLLTVLVIVIVSGM
jgi:hypothetical protein